MSERKASVVLANIVILSTALIGVPALDGVSGLARLLIELLVIGAGEAGQALGWLQCGWGRQARGSSYEQASSMSV